MSRQKKILTVYIVIVVVLIGGILGFRIRKTQNTEEESSGHTQEERYVTYNGKKYEYNYNLRNILFLGVDREEAMTEREAGRGGQSDTLILLIADKEDKTTTLLEISRDTMADIRIYDTDGNYLSTERAQITLQYAYGDGRQKSCHMTKEAVSNLLYGIPISSHVALSVDGIATVTDLIGGVKMTIPEDYTTIDPAFQKGTELVLNGRQAERYVRYRDTNVTGSNNQRMERQTQFLQALARKLQGKDFSWYQKLMKGAKAYITTDISTDEVERLTQYQMKEKVEIVPGTVRQGEKHDEFVVDNEKLQELVIKLFYKPVD